MLFQKSIAFIYHSFITRPSIVNLVSILAVFDNSAGQEKKRNNFMLNEIILVLTKLFFTVRIYFAINFYYRLLLKI
jgi:hypothetical protein